MIDFLCMYLLENMAKFSSWVDLSRFLNHHAISLELKMGDSGPPRPFKFNHEWMKVDGFKDLIAKVWSVEYYMHVLSPLDLLYVKICRLKREVKGWVNDRTALNKNSLKEIEFKIKCLIAKTTSLTWNWHDKYILVGLEN